ncbi:unnamed protein product, partial [Urochloa humidicola]
TQLGGGGRRAHGWASKVAREVGRRARGWAGGAVRARVAWREGRAPGLRRREWPAGLRRKAGCRARGWVGGWGCAGAWCLARVAGCRRPGGTRLRGVGACGSAGWRPEGAQRGSGDLVVARPNHMHMNLVVRVRSFFSLPDGGEKNMDAG